MKVLILIFSFFFILEQGSASITTNKLEPRVVALELSFVEALLELGIAPVGVSDDGDPKRIYLPYEKK